MSEVVYVVTDEYDDMLYPCSLASGVKGWDPFTSASPSDMFLDSLTTRESCFKSKFVKDSLLECCVKDDAGSPQNTVIVQVVGKVLTGPEGHA